MGSVRRGPDDRLRRVELEHAQRKVRLLHRVDQKVGCITCPCAASLLSAAGVDGDGFGDVLFAQFAFADRVVHDHSENVHAEAAVRLGPFAQ